MSNPSPHPVDWRAAVDAAIAEGNDTLALHFAESLWHAAPSLPNAGFIKTRLKPVAERMGFARKRVAIPRSFTVETTLPLLEAAALVSRIVLDAAPGQYNAYIQELMAPPAEIPDATLIALHTRTAAPALWEATDAAAMASAAVWLRDNLERALAAYRSTVSTPIIIQLLDAPPQAPQAVAEINAGLAALAAAIPDCHCLDLNPQVVAGAPWHDDRNWQVAKIPYRNVHAGTVAAGWFQYLRPVLGAPYKVIVTDLDNTLWGGVLGEDGEQGLMMDEQGFSAIQKALKGLKDRGFLLAVASKNDAESALRVLANHPACLLRPEDFAATRINWEPKSANIAAMAADLNLGLDAFVFLDDNPAERAEVASRLPAVRILPHDPATPAVTAAMLAAHPDLRRLVVTKEDRRRTEMYRSRQAAADAGSGLSREEFLASLDQEMMVEPLTSETFGRLAELERKTNQFNLRTRRLTEADLRAFAGTGTVLALRVTDRFGDHGIVGLAVASFGPGDATIESFLMSCRVIGRDIESAMLALIGRAAREHGCSRLVGAYAPTAKNAMAKDFYQNHGFKELAPLQPDGAAQWWARALAPNALPLPASVRIARGETP